MSGMLTKADQWKLLQGAKNLENAFHWKREWEGGGECLVTCMDAEWNDDMKRAVEKVLGLPYSVAGWTLAVTHWNDEVAASKEQVVSVLRKAAEL